MPDLTGAIWRKSSRSGNGGNCVEVATNLVNATWHKSSRSNNGGQCVEVADLSTQGVVGVRDSKDPNGPAFALAPSAFAAFLDSVKGGDFDL